jgi:hypothetical protein
MRGDAAAIHRLPRRPGAGRTVAPSPPFSDPKTVTDLVRPYLTEVGDFHRIRVTVTAGRLETLAAGLAGTGVAGLEIHVEAQGLVTARAVRLLAEAGVAGLSLAGYLALTTRELPDWIELGKAVLRHGLPFEWAGSVPGDAVAHVRHLPPPHGAGNWRFGMLTWRRGPRYVEVTDARGGLTLLTVDRRATAAVFGPELDRIAGEHTDPVLIGELAAAGLVAVFHGRAVWLPYRLSTWPVCGDW